MRRQKGLACHAAPCITTTFGIARSRKLIQWTQHLLESLLDLLSLDWELAGLAQGTFHISYVHHTNDICHSIYWCCLPVVPSVHHFESHHHPQLLYCTCKFMFDLFRKCFLMQSDIVFHKWPRMQVSQPLITFLILCYRGNSKYHYYGIRIKGTSPLNQYTDDQTMALRQQPVNQGKRCLSDLLFYVSIYKGITITRHKLEPRYKAVFRVHVMVQHCKWNSTNSVVG